MAPLVQPRPTVLVTGIAGNLGARLLPLLSDYRVVGFDVRAPQGAGPSEFHTLNLGHESSCRDLTTILRQTGAHSVIHLAFADDPEHKEAAHIERMWQINIAGTARVMEAISVVNRTGGHIRQFIFPSSASVYGSNADGPVVEDFPVQATTPACAVHKRESDEVVRYRAASLGDCRTYILRPSIFAGASMKNYIVDVLRGSRRNDGRRADVGDAARRIPWVLPVGKKYSEQRLQFVHVDDVARLLVHILNRSDNDAPLTILNVAAHGEPLTIAECAQIAHARIRRVPTRAACQLVLKMMWKWGGSPMPPDAAPCVLGASTMDTSRLRQFLGPHYEQVMRYSTEEALRDSFPQG